jgi:hypothetical protein
VQNSVVAQILQCKAHLMRRRQPKLAVSEIGDDRQWIFNGEANQIDDHGCKKIHTAAEVHQQESFRDGRVMKIA